jgi:hypothetical protein
MRIIVVSPPRFGNHWVKCLLAAVYGLKQRGGSSKPGTNRRGFGEDVAGGDFPDGSIFHYHGRFNRRLIGQFEALPAHVVTVVRDPYDAFVSYFEWVHSRRANDGARPNADRSAVDERPRSAMLDRAIDDPEVLAFLRDGYGVHLQRSMAWLHSGRALVVRFEDLSADQVGELQRLTDRIEPVARERIAAAIAHCEIANVKASRERLARTVRSGNVGESRTRLGEDHLRVLRETHGALIASLGYEVR